MSLGNARLCSATLPSVAAVSTFLVTTSIDAAVLRYRAVLLEPLNGGPVSEALSINASGMVGGTAGSATVNPGQHAVIWSGEQILNLDSTFNLSAASVINDSGAIAGHGTYCPPVDGACTGTIARALPGGAFVTVGTLGGVNGEVKDINAAGDFVGWWYEANFNGHAFRFTESGGVENLETLGGHSSEAIAINDAGDIAGNSYTSSFLNHAFRWSAGVMHDLGTLGGSTSEAFDMNQAGVIVGGSSNAAGDSHAFRVVGKNMQDIQTLRNAVRSTAMVINNAGMIGGVWSDGTNQRLFIYTEATGMVDIGAPVADFQHFGGPIDINESGRMIGRGLTNMYELVNWCWSPESGLRTMTAMMAGTPGLQVVGVAAINDAGQIAANVSVPGQSTQHAARLEVVAPADLTADGHVNVADLLVVITTWGSADAVADINASGVVDVADLLAVITAWD